MQISNNIVNWPKSIK